MIAVLGIRFGDSFVTIYATINQINYVLFFFLFAKAVIVWLS